MDKSPDNPKIKIIENYDGNETSNSSGKANDKINNKSNDKSNDKSNSKKVRKYYHQTVIIFWSRFLTKSKSLDL